MNRQAELNSNMRARIFRQMVGCLISFVFVMTAAQPIHAHDASSFKIDAKQIQTTAALLKTLADYSTVKNGEEFTKLFFKDFSENELPPEAAIFRRLQILPNVDIDGNSLIFALNEQKFAIEVVDAAQSLFRINGRKIFLDRRTTPRERFKLLQEKMKSPPDSQARFRFLELVEPQANAIVPIIMGAAYMAMLFLCSGIASNIVAYYVPTIGQIADNIACPHIIKYEDKHHINTAEWGACNEFVKRMKDLHANDSAGAKTNGVNPAIMAEFAKSFVENQQQRVCPVGGKGSMSVRFTDTSKKSEFRLNVNIKEDGTFDTADLSLKVEKRTQFNKLADYKFNPGVTDNTLKQVEITNPPEVQQALIRQSGNAASVPDKTIVFPPTAISASTQLTSDQMAQNAKMASLWAYHDLMITYARNTYQTCKTMAFDRLRNEVVANEQRNGRTAPAGLTGNTALSNLVPSVPPSSRTAPAAPAASGSR